MLKLLFWLLLGANGLLYGYGQGYFGRSGALEREPARLANQLNADKLRLLPSAPPPPKPPVVEDPEPAPVVVATPRVVTPPPAPKPAPPPAPKPPQYACLDISGFAQADARRFESQLAALKLGDRLARRSVPGQEISSYLVNIPPQGSKDGADRKAAELKLLGIDDFFIISDNSPMRWAISLGLFKNETGAQNMLAALGKQGVHSAKITPRYGGSKLLAYQLRDLDGAEKSRVDRIRAGFQGLETHGCK